MLPSSSLSVKQLVVAVEGPCRLDPGLVHLVRDVAARVVVELAGGAQTVGDDLAVGGELVVVEDLVAEGVDVLRQAAVRAVLVADRRPAEWIVDLLEVVIARVGVGGLGLGAVGEARQVAGGVVGVDEVRAFRVHDPRDAVLPVALEGDAATARVA